MTDRQHADYYPAFLRGYAAALNQADVDFAAESAAYLEGFLTAAQPVGDPRRYRDFSIGHEPVTADTTSGSFNGSLAGLLRTAPS